MSPALRAPRLAVATWPTWTVLLLVVASAYKWRNRDPTEAVGGAPDLAILVELAAYGVVALFLLVTFGRTLLPRPSLPTPLWLLYAYLGLLALSATYSLYASYAVVRAGQALVLLALAVAIGLHARRAQLHHLAIAFVGLVLVSLAYGVAVPSEPLSALQEGRFTWLAIHPTSSSVLTAIAFVISVFWATVPRTGAARMPQVPRWACAGAAGACLAGLLASQTRASVLGAAVGAVLVVVLQQRGRARLALLGGMLVAGLLLVFAGSAQVQAFLVRGEDPERLATLNSRTDLWSVAWDAVLEEPLFGYGLGASRGLFYEATGLGGGHNAVVNVLVEAGLLGVLAWGAVVVAIGLGVARPLTGAAARGGDDRPLVLALLATLMVVGIFNDGPGAVANGASTWLFVLVAWVVVRRREAGISSRQPSAVVLRLPDAVERRPEGAAPPR